MKKFVIFSLLICCFMVTGCSKINVSVIGGSDGPTQILVSNEGENKGSSEIESLKMVNIDGCLYYEAYEYEDEKADSSAAAESLEKAVGEFEIPKNSGEANFFCENGYVKGRRANTIEIIDDDDLEVFEKIDTNRDILKYKYCYVLEGTLPNAKEESEYLVLANTMDITFEDASYNLLGSNTEKMKDIYVLPVVD